MSHFDHPLSHDVNELEARSRLLKRKARQLLWAFGCLAAVQAGVFVFGLLIKPGHPLSRVDIPPSLIAVINDDQAPYTNDKTDRNGFGAAAQAGNISEVVAQLKSARWKEKPVGPLAAEYVLAQMIVRYGTGLELPEPVREADKQWFEENSSVVKRFADQVVGRETPLPFQTDPESLYAIEIAAYGEPRSAAAKKQAQSHQQTSHILALLSVCAGVVSLLIAAGSGVLLLLAGFLKQRTLRIGAILPGTSFSL
ncbi:MULTISPECIES: hypothetical protein [Pseudomonas]|uniref:hypothetical protein n=1 Tax=Pseudomonas TaxID=286 RepID=UPI000F767D16|nr:MULTISPECIES: hypothetical protein [Pseudomonas]RRW43186.1 hypothetical protein EGJ50_19350 [Pseudomonas luteola]